jgi:type I restriction enzyme, S subunit
MKQYDQYKPAGVEWLNHIPEHWEKKKVKYLLEIFGRIGFRGYTIEDIVEEGSGALSLSHSNIKGNKIVLDQRTYISWDKYHESPEIQIFKDDIVFVKTGSTIGKIAIIPALDEKLTLNPQMAVFKNVRINKKFLYYFFLTPIVKAELDINMIGGAAQTISQEKLNSIEVFVPSYPEQTAIAAYLDDKTAKIDTLIRNKQKLIELLKEEKAALINEAVTKGINPYVPLKPSGIDWLGDIPEHWEVKKLKYLSPYVTVGIVVNPSSYYQDNGIPTLRSLNIKENSISKQDLVYISEDANELNTKSKIFKGDLVAVRTGKPGTTADYYTPLRIFSK